MKPEEFYTQNDLPTHGDKNRMWKNIARAAGGPQVLLAIRDRRSFLWGMAAAVILLLSGTGLFSLASQALNANQPPEIRFDDAYRSAIREFESVLPSVTPVASHDKENDRLRSRQSQLALIDSAIIELRSDIARTDLSPLKRSRLRQLYSMKLQVLQDIIQQGDIEL